MTATNDAITYNQAIAGILRWVAWYREKLHKNQSSSRPLSKEYEYIGLLGEFVFSQEFDMPIDLSLRKYGDGRKDFISPIGTIDIKTAEKAYNLLRERGKRHADILVLGQYIRADDWVKLLGWEYDKAMIECPYKDFGYGIVNHYKHASKLRPMSELKKLLEQQYDI